MSHCVSVQICDFGVDFFLLSVCRSVVTVVRYSTRSIQVCCLAPIGEISLLDVLLIGRGARNCGYWCIFEEIGGVIIITLYHAHDIFIRVTNHLVYYQESGLQCCFHCVS